MTTTPAAKPRITFRPLVPADLPMLREWLCRPHVSRWWGEGPSQEEVDEEYLPLIDPGSSTRAYIAMLDDQPLGFIQSYVVLGSGDGWWEQETDPGARGIDQLLANVEQLGQGLGSAMVRAFVEMLFLDPAVTKVQTDPSPDNERAIRSYVRAGFQAVGEVDTPDGRALVMVQRRPGHRPVEPPQE